MTISWATRKRTESLGDEMQPLMTSPTETAEIAPPISSTCRVTTHPDLGIDVFGLDGELDTVTAKEVQVMLTSAIGDGAVLLDLSEVRSLDAEGVATLRDVIRLVYNRGGRVAISRPWRLARPLLGLVGAEGLVFLSLSPKGAIDWLDQQPRSPLEPGPTDRDVQPQFSVSTER